MECHSVCNLFPEMSAADFTALVDDIAANGQRETIKTHEGQIVDGRHRYRACCLLSIAPRFEEWDGKGSLTAYVVSLNLHRRHLDTSQRAAVAAEVKPLLMDEGRRRMQAGAKQTNAKRWESGSTNLKNPTDEPFDATEKAAAMLNVGYGTVANASKLREEAPDLFEEVKQGKTTVHAARKRLDERNGVEKPRRDRFEVDHDDNLIRGWLSPDPRKAAKQLVEYFQGERLGVLIDALSQHAEY